MNTTSSCSDQGEWVQLAHWDVAVPFVLRFPLFGGWQTRYYIGYNVPSYEYLFHSGSSFALKMRVVDHVFDNQVVDEVTVRIILPEGSK